MINQTVVDNPVFAAFISTNRNDVEATLKMYVETPHLVREYFLEQGYEITMDELNDLCDTVRASLERL